MKQRFATLLLLVAVGTFGQNQQLVIEDPAQLIGKQINVQRLPLCQPGTYNADLSHSGKQATVVSVKPSKMMPAVSSAALNRLNPEMRAIVEDQQKAALLLLQFEAGTKLDSCAPIGPKKLSEYVELAPGQTLTALPQPKPNSAVASATVSASAVKLGESNWQIVETKDPLTDARTVVFTNRPSVTSARAIRINCDGNGHLRNVLFDSDSVIGHSNEQYIQVFVRFDDGKVESRRWDISTDFRTLYAGGGFFANNSKAMVKDLMRAKRIRIRYPVFGGTWVTEDYNLSGLDVQKVHDYCGAL